MIYYGLLLGLFWAICGIVCARKGFAVLQDIWLAEPYPIPKMALKLKTEDRYIACVLGLAGPFGFFVLASLNGLWKKGRWS